MDSYSEWKKKNEAEEKRIKQRELEIWRGAVNAGLAGILVSTLISWAIINL